MSSISFSVSKAVAAPKKAQLTPGIYDSVVTSVAYASAYVEGQAIEIEYKLTASDGKHHTYKEIFFNDFSNPRSAYFFEHLKKIGIPLDALETFVGTREKLVIKKSTRGRFMTIESREFVSDSSDV